MTLFRKLKELRQYYMGTITEFREGDVFRSNVNGKPFVLTEESATSWNTHGSMFYPKKYYLGNIKENPELIEKLKLRM